MKRGIDARTVWKWVLLGSPALIAVILTAPCIRFAFIIDDYNFLQRATDFRLEQLVPDARSAFYRPVSRELYFWILNSIAPSNPVFAHAANALLLAVAVSLFATLCVRLGGLRFGIVSGLFFATLGVLPMLVAWVSCSQDLLAMIFIVAAMLAAAVHRIWLSAVLVGLGLLSKETTIFFVPAVLYLGVRGMPIARTMTVRLVPYSAVFVLWGAIHPKIRSFLLGDVATGSGGYVGLDNPRAVRNALRMLGTFINIPQADARMSWPDYLTGTFVLALVALCAIAWVYRRDLDPPQKRDRAALWTGMLIAVVPGLLTVVSVKRGFPYYTCIPAMGTSMLVAYALQGVRGRVAAAILALFLISGIWYRGAYTGRATFPNEADFRAATFYLNKAQTQLHKLRPQFPESARVYSTIETLPSAGLHLNLLYLQALRTWYRQGSITTSPAEYQERGRWPEYLFCFTEGGDVFEITLPSLGVRSPGPRPSYESYQRAVRSYALGAWAAGDTERGVAVLTSIQEVDSLSWQFDRRLAAAILFASARDGEAERLLQGLPALPYESAIGGVSAALTPVLPRPGLDDHAFRAFGLSLQDTTAYSELMFYFSDKVLLGKAKRTAEKILALDPTDEDAKAMLAAIAKVPEWEPVMVPAEGWEGAESRFEQAY